MLAHVLDRAANGTRVVYVPGNHDATVRPYVSHAFAGTAIEPERVHETADGRRLLVVHGDGFDLACSRWLGVVGDLGYDGLLFLNRWVNRARRSVGLPYWSLAAELKARIGQAAEFIARFEAAAAREAATRGFEGIVCGHIHKPALARIEGVLYCNTGDWVENCTALVEYHDSRFEIVRWADEAGVLHHEHPHAGGWQPLPARTSAEPCWGDWSPLATGTRGWPFGR